MGVRRIVRDFEVGPDGVAAREGVQFVVATLSVSPESYAVAAAGVGKVGLYTPTKTPHSPDPGDGLPDPRHLATSVAVDGERDPAGRPFWTARHAIPDDRQGFAFPVPVGEHDEVAIVWRRTEKPDVRWHLDEGTVARLATSPRFDVTVDVPATAPPGSGTVDVTLSVENTGDRDGVFLARIAVEDVAPRYFVELPVPRGENASTSQEVGLPHEGAGQVRVDWELDAVERTVERGEGGG